MIDLKDIQAAQKRIHGVATRTPLIAYPSLQSAGCLWLKPESLQPIGAFKLRGAYNKIASLSDEEKSRGVIAFSSGNHAQGVAYAARVLGIEATIVMPAIAPQIKKVKTKALGATVVELADGSEEDWRVAAEALAQQRGLIMVPPFEDELVIAGAGTVGLEIFEDQPQADVVFVPVGGGGLLSGTAAALKLCGGRAKIIGVEPEVANDAQRSFHRGEIVEIPLEEARRTSADGMRATRLGDLTFAHIREFADDIITVSEAQIAQAMRQTILDARLVVEPSGAVAVAAALFHNDAYSSSGTSVAVISGGNVDATLLAEIILGH